MEITTYLYENHTSRLFQIIRGDTLKALSERMLNTLKPYLKEICLRDAKVLLSDNDIENIELHGEFNDGMVFVDFNFAQSSSLQSIGFWRDSHAQQNHADLHFPWAKGKDISLMSAHTYLKKEWELFAQLEELDYPEEPKKLQLLLQECFELLKAIRSP